MGPCQLVGRPECNQAVLLRGCDQAATQTSRPSFTHVKHQTTSQIMSSSFHHSSASSYSSIHSFIQPEPQQPFISSTLALISVLKSKKDSNPEKQKTASLGRYLLCSIAEPSGPQAYLVAAARTLVRASEPSLGCSTGAKWPHIASPQQPHSVSNEGRSES